MNKKNIFLAVLVVLFIVIIAYNTKIQNMFQSEIDKKLVSLDGVAVNAEIADSEDEREQGLMFRKELGSNEGMLFVFDDENFRIFWMKNTLISLDLIFIDGNKAVVDVQEGFLPCKRELCESYTSKAKAKYVLEVNAGFAAENSIKDGDVVSFTD